MQAGAAQAPVETNRQLLPDQNGAGTMPEALLLPNVRLSLFPFLVRQNNAQDYSLVRLGCETVTVLSTTQSGVIAARLMKAGYSPAEAGARVASLFKRDHVNLAPLLKALYEARMIRSINGQPAGPEVPSFIRQGRQRIEWLRIRATAVIGRQLVRSLPVPIMHRALCMMKPKWTRGKLANARQETQKNLQAVFGGSLSARRIRLLAHESVKEQIRREADLRLLSDIEEAKAGRWLRRYCTFQGLEHLDAALATGNGVLLSSFHFSSAHLIVLLLWLRGYSFTGAGGITRNNRHRLLPFENAELAKELKGCGTVKWFTTMTLESALNICRTLNRGGLGLVFPDGFTTRSKGEVDAYFGHNAALYKRAHCDVPFLGRVAQANTGVPWIYKQSTAPMIPIKLIRDSYHCFQVIVGPELKLDREASLDKITADLYAALAREVSLDPAPWVYWRVLDQFTTAS